MSHRAIIALSVALGGCASQTPTPAAPQPDPTESTPAVAPPVSLEDGHVTYQEYQETAAQAQASLERLGALELLTLGELVVDAPTGPANCYGPCADDATDQAWMQEHARQAERLDALVDAAESAAEAATAADPGDIGASIEALDALRIVEVDGMYHDQAAGCYVGTCPGDEERAGAIEELAQGTHGL